jgi:hypothetical protein
MMHFTWNFHLCPNEEISPNSLSCPVVHTAWKAMWKKWEFCTCPLIDNGTILLDMENYVNGTFLYGLWEYATWEFFERGI